MDANTVTAICATGIAVASLTVSILEARAARQHNRHAVRPLLTIRTGRRQGGLAGPLLVNYGLGPAIITKSVVMLDGQPIGQWDEEGSNRVREGLPVRPHAVTFRDGQPLPVGFEAYLLCLEDFDRDEHAWFWDLVRRRIHVEIHYESLYGNEQYKVALNAPAAAGR